MRVARRNACPIAACCLLCLVTPASVRAQGASAPAAEQDKGSSRRVAPLAYDQFGRGVTAKARGDYDAALRFLSSALKHDPESPSIHRELADVYRERDNTAKAIEHYQEALERGPDDGRANWELGRLYFRASKPKLAIKHLEKAAGSSKAPKVRVRFLLATLYRMTRQLPQCARQYEIVLRSRPSLVLTSEALVTIYKQLPQEVEALRENAEKAGPSDFLPHFRLSQALLAKKDLDGAIGALQKAVEKEPEWTAGFEMLGKLFVLKERLPDAIEAYKHASVGHPDQLDLLYRAAELHLKQRQIAQAAEVLEQIRAKDPKFQEALIRLAYCYRAQGKDGKVIEVGEEYVSGAGAKLNHAIYELLGQAYAQKGLKTKAYECAAQLQVILQKTKEKGAHTTISRMTSRILSELRDYKEAISVLEEATSRNPEHAETWLDLAVLYDEEKRDEEAERVLRGVLSNHPRNHRALNHLGYLYADRGRNIEEAVSLIRKALDAEPSNWAYLDSLGWAYYRQGRLKEALEKLQEAIKIHDDPVVREHLGDVLHASGDHRGAAEHWTRALKLSPGSESLKQKIGGTSEK